MQINLEILFYNLKQTKYLVINQNTYPKNHILMINFLKIKKILKLVKNMFQSHWILIEYKETILLDKMEIFLKKL